MIEKILNRLSKNNEIFKDSITGYQNALTNSNFKHKLKIHERPRHEKQKEINTYMKNYIF